MSKTLLINGQEQRITIHEQSDTHIMFELEGQRYHFERQHSAQGITTLIQQDGDTRQQWQCATATPDRNGETHIWVDGTEFSLTTPSRRSHSRHSAPNDGPPIAPLSGIIRSILVKNNDNVNQGDALLVMEAMKMQTTITTSCDGVVAAIHVQEGQQVTEGTELIEIKSNDDD